MRRVKKYFFSGLAVFLPLGLTIYVCIWFLNFTESLVGKYLKPFLLENYDFYIWGLGILVLVVLILFFGFVVTNYFGRAVHRMTERVLMRIPVMGSIYPAFKEIARFIFKEEDPRARPQQVVLVEWPRPGIYVLGLLTNVTSPVICSAAGKELVNVLIPKVPNPLTGFVVMVPREDVINIPISVEEAVRIIVSGGVLDPHGQNSEDEKVT